MPLEFVEDAIKLSGLTGTKLKCDVIGLYYPFWWGITSGGAHSNYRNPTAIIELNAATGEVYIEDTKETVLGSAGHALELKVKNNPNTRNLKVVLVEENNDCYEHLKKVIKRRWDSVFIENSEGAINSNASNIYLLKMTLDKALDAIEDINLGNSLYFFDPLLSVEYSSVEKVASKRIETFYQTGTEFIIFLFTSDWFLGRKLNDKKIAPLPCTLEEAVWTEEERGTVSEADALFGNKEWRNNVLNNNPIEEKEKSLIELYRNRLHKWFRYVLPLPFNPKRNQIFHLILCSNYEDGVKATRDSFYAERTDNPRYSPNNPSALKKFRALHPELFKGLKGATRPLQWRILWKIITKHEEGVCDCMCRDFEEDRNPIGRNPRERQELLEWLEGKGYLEPFLVENAWNSPIKKYILNWKFIKAKLGVDPPLPLIPLSLEMIKI